MSKSAPSKFREALEVFARHDANFIVVGGVAAVLQGAPISTFDLDLVHARTPENIDRLLAALADLGARYRDQTGRTLIPKAEQLAGPGHHLLVTRAGPVDLLGTIGRGRDYDDLLADTVVQKLGDLQVRVLDLAAVIRVKEEVADAKDQAALPILRRTLAERSKGK